MTGKGIRTVLLLLTLSPSVTRGAQVVARVSADMASVSTSADQVSGADYTRKYVNPTVVNAAVGMNFLGPIYLGVRFEDWLAGRSYTLNNVSHDDTLTYKTVGLEVGYQHTGPRFLYLFTAGAHYPLAASIKSQTGTTSDAYTTSGKPILYEARAELALRLSRLFMAVLEGGYRFASLGNFSAGPFPYLGDGPFDLSGPFAGVGLGVIF